MAVLAGCSGLATGVAASFAGAIGVRSVLSLGAGVVLTVEGRSSGCCRCGNLLATMALQPLVGLAVP